MGLSIDEQFGLDEERSCTIPGRSAAEATIDHRSGHAALKAIGDVFGGSLHEPSASERSDDRLRRAEADRDDAQAQVRNLTAQLASDRQEDQMRIHHLIEGIWRVAKEMNIASDVRPTGPFALMLCADMEAWARARR